MMDASSTMKTAFLCTFVLLTLINTASAVTLNVDQVPPAKQTQDQHYLSPQEVFELKTKEPAQTLLVDIRTPAELQFVGYTPLIDGNVPYITYDYSDWDAKNKEYKRDFNSGFTVQIETLLTKSGISGGKQARIILMCRSGDRSAKAADLLAKSGYTNVWSAIEGFEGDKAKDGPNKGKRTVNGWKNANLPWTYDLDKSKAFLE
jgi:rhodanese-related sulfurtransferase